MFCLVITGCIQGNFHLLVQIAITLMARKPCPAEARDLTGCTSEPKAPAGQSRTHGITCIFIQLDYPTWS